MDRRSYLGSLAGAGVAGFAGCLENASIFDDSETALGPRERDFSEADFPAHGQEFPSFSIPDPMADQAVSLEDFVGDRSFLMTFIFTSCTDDCGALVNMLQLVQEDAAERGYEEDLGLLSMTFDPVTDDADALRDYGEQRGVDVDAENWHFLRPETQDRALSLVNETFGAPVEVMPPDEGDHYDDSTSGNESDGNADHNETDHNESENQSGHDGETTTHYYMIFLVNDQGVVERSYPNAPTNTKPNELIEDVRTVVE